MDNLINFEENDDSSKNSTPSKKQKNPAINHPLLVNDRLSLELNNPFDKCEYRATHSDDPFECLNKMKADEKSNSAAAAAAAKNGSPERGKKDELKPAASLNGQSMGGNDTSVISVASSNGSSKSQVVRCQSDSSTISGHEGSGNNMSRFSSVDNILSKKTNQLLRLSLLNSPNSPLHSQSFGNLPATDSVYLEAKNISEMLKNYNDLSFDDLNNISMQLIDTSNLSVADPDLEELRISFLEKNPMLARESSPLKIEDAKDSMQDKITCLQQKLDKIKKEEKVEFKSEAKVEPTSPKQADAETAKKELEVDGILQRIKTLMKDNKRDEAKKQLQLLNEMLTPSSASEATGHLQVAAQPFIRQDTFEIDQATGKRRYSSSSGCAVESDSGEGSSTNSSTNDLMEQLAKLLGAQSLDVSSLNLSGSNNNVVVIVPKMPSPAATPIKQSNPARRSMSFSTQRPAAARGIENKKLSTPMKHTAASTLSASVARRSSFTAPRQPPLPSDQKLNIGAVRKSLMGSMEQSPRKAKSPPLKKSLAPPRPATVRRSVSLKATVPIVTVSQATPRKIPPPSATPSKAKAPATRTASTPTPSRKALATGGGGGAASSRPSTTMPNAQKPSGIQKRPVTTSQKTEYKTPYGSVTKK